MARTLHDPAARADIVRRLGDLAPGSPARWGRMTAGQVVCHLGDVQEAIYEGRGAAPGRPFLRSFPLKHLALYVVPFPRGVKAPRVAFRTTPSEFARDRERAQQLVAEFAERAGRNGWGGHPYFGPLTAGEWGVFAYKHADHHLRQFGV